MFLTKDFSTEEMACPCCGACEMDPLFMAKLQTLRTQWCEPIHINSGFRCAKHNAQLEKASPTSRHLKGMAADCRIEAHDRFDFLKLALEVGFTGVGIGSNFIHLDTRETNHAVWVY